MMTPERWQEIKQVLGTALEMDFPGRSVYLDHACGGDLDLRRQVERFLASQEKAGDFLCTPPSLTALQEDSGQGETYIGQFLGPYLILELIGEGGMGYVFRGIRADDQYEKHVAIKLVESPRKSSFVMSRFRNERQILANLDHPNIARLLDGGTTANGVPYFVMELIAGKPIDEYCDDHQLNIEDRLNIFLAVCSAVEYAHRHLIVHRDIKPGNILVTSEGVPKLLDFGIAKIVDSASAVAADLTTTNLRIFTPAYASPEQVKGQQITTASDVYSLGVVLYELLVGHHPYHLEKQTPEILSRAICEREPERLSTAVRRKAVVKHQSPEITPDSVSAARQCSVKKLRKQLRGDLEKIVSMSLRKEPERRYGTVDQFAEDIRRHLKSLPVSAHRDSIPYRARKFALRHKAGAAATAVVILTALCAFIITVNEARIAQRRFNDVRALSEHLAFDVYDSIATLPGSTPSRKMIADEAAQYLNQLTIDSGGDTGLQRELASAYEKLGTVQGHYGEDNLGDVNSSLETYKKALDLRERIDASSPDWNDHLALARSRRLVADMQAVVGSRREARANVDRAIAISESLAKELPGEFQILHELGVDYYVSDHVGYPDDPDERTKLQENSKKALATDEAAVKIKPRDLDALSQYAISLRRMGLQSEDTNPRAALDYYTRELEIETDIVQHSKAVRYARAMALAYRDLATVYDNLGAYDRSVENSRQSLAIMKDINGADPQNATIRQSLAIEQTNMALALAKGGKYRLALEEWRGSEQLIRKLALAAPDNRLHRHFLAAIIAAGGTILMHAHNPKAALKQFDESRKIYLSLRDSSGATPFEIASAAQCSEKMGEAESALGDIRAAVDDFHEALVFAEPLIATTPANLNALYGTADAYSGLGDIFLRKAQSSREGTDDSYADWEAAHSWYLKSAATWHQIEHPNRSTPGNSLDAGDPAQVARKLKLCGRILAMRHPAS